jgi:uncharacterized membrane protein
MILLDVVSLVLLMLVTGIFWGPWFSLHRSMATFSKGEFIHLVRTISANLAIPMRFMMPSCVILVFLEVYAFPLKNALSFYLALGSLALILLALVVTIGVEVPIVKMIEKWTVETVPEDWRTIQERWLQFHKIRVFAAITSFICLLIAILSIK